MSENGVSQEVVDPNGPLTDRELNAIFESWSMIYRKEHRKQNGVKLFLKLFEMYPAAKDKFEFFKGKTLDELAVHKKLPAHATSVMYALASYVDSLDIEDTELLVELVRKTAKSHVERGVGVVEFKWLSEVVPAWMDEILEEECTDLMKCSWIKLLNTVVGVVAEEEKEWKK